MWKGLLFVAVMVHASSGVFAADGGAGSYPNKPIRVIDGFPAGGSTDYLARSVGAKPTERSGQQVLVENRPGQTTNVAAALVAR